MNTSAAHVRLQVLLHSTAVLLYEGRRTHVQCATSGFEVWWAKDVAGAGNRNSTSVCGMWSFGNNECGL